MKNGRLMHSVVLLFLLVSCSFFSTSDPTLSAKHSYTLPKFNAWPTQVTDKADYLFVGPHGASLMAQSFCNEFQASSLAQLASQTFNSLDKAKIIEQKDFSLQQRNALRTQGEAYLDGVRVHLTLVNTKRNNCYYDFLEILPDENISSMIDNLLQEIRFK